MAEAIRPSSEEAVEAPRAEIWEGCTALELAASWGAPEVHLFSSVGSTNDVARELASAGAVEGTIVLAEEQRSGRGRVGRSWASPPGLGLWLSVVGRPRARDVPALPVRVGIALAIALEDWTGGHATRVKWPNDLLIGDRKVGGILCEASWAGNTLDHAVIGVGLNLLHKEGDFPVELRTTATSLAAAARQPVSRFDVATAVVQACLESLRDPALSDDLLAELRTRDALLGHGVEVREPETGNLIAAGRAEGIDPAGCLRLSTSAGTVTVTSGTVRTMGSKE